MQYVPAAFLVISLVLLLVHWWFYSPTPSRRHLGWLGMAFFVASFAWGHIFIR